MSRVPSIGTLLIACSIGAAACGENPVEVADSPPVTPSVSAFEPGPASPVSADRLPASASVSSSATGCSFTTVGTTMTLDADCATDATVGIPDGMTLDGNHHTITGVDPAGDHFRGAVVANDGAWAAVTQLNVTLANLGNACDSGDDRLRGILFEDASGSITHSTVSGINQGASGCQEGNAIEVRNAPFDGTHPNTQTVRIAANTVDAYQKTGIVANGDVEVVIEHNSISSSATQANLAANGIQLGFGALGSVRYNDVGGNQWLGVSNYAATAILIYLADGITVDHNRISGNSDIGLYVYGADGTYDYNDVRDFGADGAHGDYGIVDLSASNVFTNSLVCGFDESFYPDPLTGSQNKALPDPACSR